LELNSSGLGGWMAPELLRQLWGKGEGLDA
jgi:hypothetical protein